MTPEELNAIREMFANDRGDVGETVNALVAEVERLQAALAQYANSAKWGWERNMAFDYLSPHRCFRCSGDGWQIAEAALDSGEVQP